MRALGAIFVGATAEEGMRRGGSKTLWFLNTMQTQQAPQFSRLCRGRQTGGHCKELSHSGRAPARKPRAPGDSMIGITAEQCDRSRGVLLWGNRITVYRRFMDMSTDKGPGGVRLPSCFIDRSGFSTTKSARESVNYGQGSLPRLPACNIKTPVYRPPSGRNRGERR